MEKMVIKLAAKPDRHRQTFSMSREVSDEWMRRYALMKGSDALVETALILFMEKVDKGEIIIQV